MLDDLLDYDYRTVAHDIAVRLVELDFPWKESDGNIGGGRSSFVTRPQEEMIVRHSEDKRLQYLIQLKSDCDRAIKRFDDEQRRIYEYRYRDTSWHDWQEVAEYFHYAQTSMYRKRYRLLYVVAEERGIVPKDGCKSGSLTTFSELN